MLGDISKDSNGHQTVDFITFMCYCSHVMERRQVLKTVAGVLGTGAAITGTATAQQRSRDPWAGVQNDPPSGNVDTILVSPFPGHEGDDEIPAGTWLRHEVVYVNGNSAYESSPEGLRKNLEETEFDFFVDEVPLPNAKEYFGDPYFDDGNYKTLFTAYTPPRAPGEYTTTAFADNPNYEPVTVSGTHRITPGR